MQVVVCGADGATGRHLVEQARERGWTVTTVRDGTDTGPTDARDAAQVAQAVDGAVALLSVVGERDRARTTLYSDCARAYLEALDGRSCRLVFCTGAGVDEPPAADPWIRDHIDGPVRGYPGREDMVAAEALLRSSPLDWVVVRPGRLHDRPALGTVEASERFRPELGTSLARADLARFMLDQVTGDDWLRRTATLASPWD